MSKHNRRRTRGGHKASPTRHNNTSSSSTTTTTFELPALPEDPDPDCSSASSTPFLPYRRPQNLSARHWNNRYVAWQARERRLRVEQVEKEKLMRRERVWVFGGPPSDGEEEGEGMGMGEDDEGLCERMMDYFRGLDYLLE